MMGIYDLPSFYGATKELWFPEKDLCGTPWTSWTTTPALVPVERFVDQASQTPALVITGELDYRVPYTQSLMFFTALRRQGIPARLVVYPDAGHWPSWHEMAFYYNVHIDWFHQYLGGEPASYDVEEWSRTAHSGSGRVGPCGARPHGRVAEQRLAPGTGPGATPGLRQLATVAHAALRSASLPVH